MRFPVIHNIDDVLPHIQDVEGFIVVRKDDYDVINYVISTPETFPVITEDNRLTASMRRECRGLIFDKDGNIISRPYHKFFNLGEREDHLMSNIDFSRPHVILEKLDGSMIRPIRINGHWRLATKMGVTEVSMKAETYLAKSGLYQDYNRFFDALFEAGKTPIFEFCSNSQRIVLDYPEDRLVLTAIRDNEHGTYASYNELQLHAMVHGFEVVKAVEGTVENMLDLAKTSEEEEGWIVRFDDGDMVKIKCEWYVLCHRSKDLITREKNVVEMIINEAVDDVLPLLIEEDRKRVEEYMENFYTSLLWHVDLFERRAKDAALLSGFSPKTLAVETASNYGLSGLEKSFAFKYIQNREVSALEFVKDFIKKSFGSGRKFDEAKQQFFKNVKFFFEE